MKKACKYFILFFCLILNTGFYAQILFSEDFQGSIDSKTQLPLNWNESGISKDQIFQTGDSVSSRLVINGDLLWYIPNHTKFAYTSDIACSYNFGGQNCNKSLDRLILPSISFSNINQALSLDFDAFFNGKLGATAQCEYSIDNGVSWTSFFTINPLGDWKSHQVDITFLKNKSNVLIAFRFNDNNALREGLAIDNVVIKQLKYWVDLKIVSSDLTKYTSIPSTQLVPLPLNCKFTNIGSLKSDSSTFLLTIFTNQGQRKLLKSYIKKYSTIDSKDTIDVDFGSVYSNQLSDSFEFQFQIIDKQDSVINNNDLVFKTIISLNEYARDDDSVVSVLGLSSQNTITLGNMFEINKSTYIDSVFVKLDKNNMAVGSTIQAVVYPIINGIPLSNQIGFSSIYTLQANDTTSNVVFKITDTFLSRLKLDSGKYLVALNKYTNGSSLSVKMTNKYFSENAVYVKIGNANFQTLDTYFSGSYKLVPSIRMYCSPYCNLKTKITELKADCSTSKGSLISTPSNGSYPYKYKWSTGDTDSILNNIVVGTYSLNISDKFGCEFDTLKVALNYNTTPRITIDSISHPKCFGSKDGYISLNVVDSNILTKVFWNKEQTNTIYHENLLSGTYIVKVFNEANCFDSTIVSLSSPDSLNVTYIVADETPKDSGEIYLFVKGGIPPYNYFWNDSVITKNRTGLIGDSIYQVLIKDANDCASSLDIYVNKIVGVDELNFDSVKFYPNPSSGVINFTSTNSFDILIENSSGEKVANFTSNENVGSIDMSSYGKGIYLLKISTKNRYYIRKITII